jgi:hypothetical protein
LIGIFTPYLIGYFFTGQMHTVFYAFGRATYGPFILLFNSAKCRINVFRFEIFFFQSSFAKNRKILFLAETPTKKLLFVR